jgi:hypothetical protein
MRILILLSLLPVLISSADAPVRFIHPRARVVLSGIRGVDIPVQAWIERNAAHRLFEIRWQLVGDDTYQSHSKTVDGENEPTLFPDYGWMTVRLTPGEWVLTALGCTEHAEGRCTRSRVQGTTTIRVCGGESCGDGGE